MAYFKVAWNVAEGIAAIWAAVASGSDAILGFGLGVVVFVAKEGWEAFSGDLGDQT